MKSRTTFQSLIDEEKTLQAELSQMLEKFETWTASSDSNTNENVSRPNMRATSVSNRLYATK